MTVFNSFFLLFKNDAAKSKKDVADLEKQIDSLRAKGKARSSEETAAMKEAVKRHKEIQKEVKETERQTEKLGNSIATAAAAYVSFGAIKAGIVDAQQFNRAISVQSKNLGQVTQDMRAYSAAVEKAGGSQEAYLSWVEGKTRDAASQGLGPFDPKKYEQGLRNFMRNMDRSGKLSVLSSQGINDPGHVARMLMSDADYDRATAAAYEYAKSTEAADKASREFGESQDELGQSIRSLWSKVGETVLPILTGGNNSLAGALQNVSKDTNASISVFGLAASGALALSTGFFAVARSVLGVGTGIGGVAGSAAGLLGTLSRVAGLLGLIGTQAYMIFGGVKDIATGRRESLIGKGAQSLGYWLEERNAYGEAARKAIREGKPLPNRDDFSLRGGRQQTGDTGGDEMAFWQSKGLSREDAAAIIANRMHENRGMDINARGDGGAAHGYYQWQNTRNNGFRRDRIKAATGIDVSTATGNAQHEAAWWEMQHGDTGFDLATFRALSGPDAKARYFSNTFERPHDPYGMKAAERAQTALGIYGGSGLNAQGFGGSGSSSSSVKIDKIEVNTQATDAEGIADGIGSELNRVLGFGFGNIDDGVAG